MRRVPSSGSGRDVVLHVQVNVPLYTASYSIIAVERHRSYAPTGIDTPSRSHPVLGAPMKIGAVSEDRSQEQRVKPIGQINHQLYLVKG